MEVEGYVKEEKDLRIKVPPKGLMIVALLGPSIVWCAEFIGSGEVILATRTGAILGNSVLWAIVVGIFLKYWIGMSGARYTVCTGEGMIDMLGRMPGPRNWSVWVVLVIQFACAVCSIASLATAAGAFINNLIPFDWPVLSGWIVTVMCVAAVWSGAFEVLKIIMSIFVIVIIIGVMYVTVYVFPSFGELVDSLGFHVPDVPAWAVESGKAVVNPWGEILPLIGWAAGGFASQVWYTYWVLGAGYGAAAGRGYGRAADESMLRSMTTATAEKVKGWCRVLYADASLAMVIGIVVTGAFYLAGAGILNPMKQAPAGAEVGKELSTIFSQRWGSFGGFLFLLSGATALVATQVGQMAGWPRLLADSFRICIPGFSKRFQWKTQFRIFLVLFLVTNFVIVLIFGHEPVRMVKISAVIEGLLLTPMQALWVGLGLFIVLPKMLSKDAWSVLKPNWIFAVGLLAAFAVFAWLCIFHLPTFLSG